MKTLGVCDHKIIKVMQFPEPVYGMKDTNISTHYVKSAQMQSSGPYFLVFGLNIEIYEVNLHIHSEYKKIRTRKNSVFGQFLCSDKVYLICSSKA